VLKDVVQLEPTLADSRAQHGDLADLGIEKGKLFRPDARMKRILTQAAKPGCGQMRVESFADRRPDRIVWNGRQWEWAALRFENGSFDTPNYRDTYALDKWFFQAIASSPAMFRRDSGAARCTGSACATGPAPISTAAGPTRSPCRCRFRASSSGR
jgi:hypothetical protein